MTGQAPLFRYRPADTPVHRLPAGLKLAGMFLVTVAVFSAGLPGLLASSAALAFLALLARIPASVHLRNLRILLSYALFILAFRLAGTGFEAAFLRRMLGETGTYLWQLSAVLLAGTLFYETTGTLEIRHCLAAVQLFFQRLANRLLRTFDRPEAELPDIAFLLSLTISFIPRIFEAWTDLTRAWDARGGTLHRGLSGAWKRCTVLVPLLIAKLLSVAADTDRAIRNRSL